MSGTFAPQLNLAIKDKEKLPDNNCQVLTF